jgi:hypothetical protein
MRQSSQKDPPPHAWLSSSTFMEDHLFVTALSSGAFSGQSLWHEACLDEHDLGSEPRAQLRSSHHPAPMLRIS